MECSKAEGTACAKGLGRNMLGVPKESHDCYVESEGKT